MLCHPYPLSACPPVYLQSSPSSLPDEHYTPSPLPNPPSHIPTEAHIHLLIPPPHPPVVNRALNLIHNPFTFCRFFLSAEGYPYHPHPLLILHFSSLSLSPSHLHPSHPLPHPPVVNRALNLVHDPFTFCRFFLSMED